MTDSATREPLNPDEAATRGQIRRSLDVLIVGAAVSGVAECAWALIVGRTSFLFAALLFWCAGAWILAFPRRWVGRDEVAGIITGVVLVVSATLVGVAFLQPFLALEVVTAMLLPILLATPYLDGRRLQRLAVLVAVAAIAAAMASFLPEETTVSTDGLVEIIRMLSLFLVLGAVVIVVYQWSERLKASSREFGRLVDLSTQLARTSDPEALGTMLAQHLADAIGFDDCVISMLDAESGRLVPLGSYPVMRARETPPGSLSTRPILSRLASEASHLIVDVGREPAGSAERVRLEADDREVMILLPLVALAGPSGVAELTARKRRSLGERQLALLGTLAFAAAMAIDNGRLYQEAHLRAQHDPLTGLANAAVFQDRVSDALKRLPRRAGRIVAVLFADMDDFKAVNDTHGHLQGDRFLRLVGERLRTVVRPEDTVARLGGDEFGLLLEELTSVDQALTVASRAIAAVAAPMELGGRAATASLSVGVAFRAVADATADELLHEADTAMYEAKLAGKRRVVQYADAADPPGTVESKPAPSPLASRVSPRRVAHANRGGRGPAL